MDPLSQGVVGAVLAQQGAKRTQLLLATCLGFLAGLTPDLDILIHSANDPLLRLEYHRQFSHSLLFIPIGSGLCASLAFILLRLFSHATIGFSTLWLYCTLGYASHGLLDACTTYGTQLFWPLSDTRVAWHTISIIDPLFTLPLLLLVWFAAKKHSKAFALAALLWLVSYSALGIIQRERAETIAWQLAESRGHRPSTIEALPSFANLLLWRTIYTTDDHFHIDAVSVGVQPSVYPGGKLAKFNLTRDFPTLDQNSQQAEDIQRFAWFTNGYIALAPQSVSTIIDVRYASLPNDLDSLWGIVIDSNAPMDQHATYTRYKSGGYQKLMQLWQMIKGKASLLDSPSN